MRTVSKNVLHAVRFINGSITTFSGTIDECLDWAQAYIDDGAVPSQFELYPLYECNKRKLVAQKVTSTRLTTASCR